MNSPGGSIFDGLGIYNTLKSHPARVQVLIDGAALSMASAVAMAGDEIVIAENALIMIHNPVGMVLGESEDMRKQAELMDMLKAELVDIYAKRTNQTAEQIAAWMDNETWMDSSEAVKAGFADRTGAALSVAACADPDRFPRMPRKFFLNQGALKMPEPTKQPEPVAAVSVPATYDELKALCDGADPAFICGQMEAKATVPQAQKAWIAALKSQAETSRKEVEELKAQQKATAAKPGNEPLATATPKTTSDTAADPIAAWDSILAAYKATGLKQGKAISKAVREHPEEHRAYLVAYNAKLGRNID
jgi:hypothetical protein